LTVRLVEVPEIASRKVSVASPGLTARIVKVAAASRACEPAGPPETCTTPASELEAEIRASEASAPPAVWASIVRVRDEPGVSDKVSPVKPRISRPTTRSVGPVLSSRLLMQAWNQTCVQTNEAASASARRPAAVAPAGPRVPSG
jgi:hypothetical protein